MTTGAGVSYPCPALEKGVVMIEALSKEVPWWGCFFLGVILYFLVRAFVRGTLRQWLLQGVMLEGQVFGSLFFTSVL